MTIRIPRWVVIGVGLVVLCWGGAFGISYGVVEWQDDSSSIEQRFDEVEQQLRIGLTDPAPCERAIFQYIVSLTATSQSGQVGFYKNMQDACGEVKR
jgi:hypothetical protein